MQIGSVFEQAHRLVDERSIRYCAALGLSPSEDAWRALRVRVTLRLIARARAVAERRDSSIAMVLMREGGALLDRLAHESLEADVTNRMIGLVYLAVEDYGIRLFHGGDRITSHAGHVEFRRLARREPSGGHALCDCSALLGHTARRAAIDALDRGVVRSYRFLVASAAQDLRVAEGRLAKPQVFARAILEAARGGNGQNPRASQPFRSRNSDVGLLEDLLWHLHGWDPPVSTDAFMERLAVRHLGAPAYGAQAEDRIEKIIAAAVAAKPVMRTSVARNIDRLWADRFRDESAKDEYPTGEWHRNAQLVQPDASGEAEATAEWLAVKRCVDLYTAGTTSGDLLGVALSDSLERLSEESRFALTTVLQSPRRLRRVVHEYRSTDSALRATKTGAA